jgi:hypothetical protein
MLTFLVEQITPAPSAFGWNNELIGADLDGEGESNDRQKH